LKHLARLFLISFAVLSPLSASAQMFVEDFDARAQGATVLFRQPNFSGSTFPQLATAPNTSAVSADVAASPVNSYKVNWAFLAGTDRWLRLTTFNTPNLPNPTVDFRGFLSFDYLLIGPSDLRVSLGTRETGTTAALGANGGTVGMIEWVGSTTAGPAPRGKTLVASDPASTTFHTLTFDFQTEPVSAFTGNGVLSSATSKGVLESLGITQVGSFTDNNEYRLYIDNVRIVVVPEPSPLLAFGSAAFALLGYTHLRRRRK
jgi:hypothetical protein